MPAATRSPPNSWTVETHLAAVEVTGSPTLLARMIDNVIENAVRHTEPGGTGKWRPGQLLGAKTRSPHGTGVSPTPSAHQLSAGSAQEAGHN